MVEKLQSVTLREATPLDRDFLLAVFASTRGEELAALAWGPEQSQAFLLMQFNAQQQNYDAAYPAASNSIVLLAGQPVGRMLVDRGDAAVELVDIAVLPEYRSRGIGSALIRGLMDEAAAAQKPLDLSVYATNPARRLYDRLGFSKIDEESLYVRMQWMPANTPAS